MRLGMTDTEPTQRERRLWTMGRGEKLRLHGQALNRVVRQIHASLEERPRTEPRNIEAVLLACVSDLSDAAEGYAHAHIDADHPPRAMVEVRLALCMMRLCDLAGELELDLGGALVQCAARGVTVSS